MKYKCIFSVIMLSVIAVCSVFADDQYPEIRITSVSTLYNSKDIFKAIDGNDFYTSVYATLGEDLEITLEGYEFENDTKAMLIPDQAIGFFDKFSNATDFSVAGKVAYVIDNKCLKIIDLYNPMKPELVGIYSEKNLSKVKALNDTLYLVDEKGLKIFNPKNPICLIMTSKFDSIFETEDLLTVIGNKAILKTIHEYPYSICTPDGLCAGIVRIDTYLEILDMSNMSNLDMNTCLNLSDEPGFFYFDDEEKVFLYANDLFFNIGGSNTYYFTILKAG